MFNFQAPTSTIVMPVYLTVTRSLQLLKVKISVVRFSIKVLNSFKIIGSNAVDLLKTLRYHTHPVLHQDQHACYAVCFFFVHMKVHLSFFLTDCLFGPYFLFHKEISLTAFH